MFGLLPIDLFAITLFLGLPGLAVVSDIEAQRIPNRVRLAITALQSRPRARSPEPVDWLGAIAGVRCGRA